ncbi:MAG: gliding motility protein GldM [Prevotella sp.]|jgi:gliding motility-associated protein GldM
MAIKKRPISPRQKMINLMYIVLLAMLALNISTEVLNGFAVVEESLARTTDNASRENVALYGDFKDQMAANPTKVKAWYAKATDVKNMSDSLYNFAQELKLAIVREANGEEATLADAENNDNVDAAGTVMLAPITGKGQMLYDAINSFRSRILNYISDPEQRKLIASSLTTAVPKKANTLGKNWQEYMFENMPVAAAVTLLSKLQNDVRHAEGEVLHTLFSNIDLKDIRVNKLSAFVVPEKTTLYPGERFSASIVMAAMDTTKQPEIFVNGSKVNTNNGQYSFAVGGVGEHQFNGYILMHNANGDMLRRDFSQKYSVIPVPGGATLAADLMNVLYAGFKNPISVSVPGVPQNAVSVSMSGGNLSPQGAGRYIAVPSAVGRDVTFTVSARDGGRVRSFPPFTFKVRKLPDPTPYIALGSDRYKGGGLSKAGLMSASRLNAAIDDGILDIQFKVTGFSVVFYDNMGNAVQMASAGDSFTERMRGQFRRLSRGRRFYITEVKAVGPDGLARTLPGAMEVKVR